LKSTTGLLIALAVVTAACSTPQQQPPEASTAPAAAPAPDAAAAPAAPAPTTAPAAPSAPPPPPQPRIAQLDAGRTLTIRTTRLLSTKTSGTGDVFSAILEEPITVDRWVVAPAGARVDGRVVEADKGGRLKGKAGLSIELTSLTTGDGQKVEIVTTPVSADAAADKSRDAAKVGIAAGAGAAVGAIAGGGKGAAVGALLGGGAGAAMRGKAAEIAPETVVAFELRSPVTIHERVK